MLGDSRRPDSNLTVGSNNRKLLHSIYHIMPIKIIQEMSETQGLSMILILLLLASFAPNYQPNVSGIIPHHYSNFRIGSENETFSFGDIQRGHDLVLSSSYTKLSP